MHAQTEHAEHYVHQVIEDLGRRQYLTQAFGERTLIAHNADDVHAFHYYLR